MRRFSKIHLLTTYSALMIGLCLTGFTDSNAWAQPQTSPEQNREELRSAVYSVPQLIQSHSVESETDFPDFKISQFRIIPHEWNGEKWQHTLLLIMPKNLSPTSAKEIVLISTDESAALQGEDKTITELRSFYSKNEFSVRMIRNSVTPWIQKIQRPIALLKQIPYSGEGSPSWEQRIAGSFDSFRKTSSIQSHILVPMIRSILGAQDVLDEFLKISGHSHYILAGGSKAAWASWLAAITDKKSRTSAIISFAYNALNFSEHLLLHDRAWGKLSEQMMPYQSLAQALKGDESSKSAAKELIRKMDPYEYLSLLNIPKLMVHGANDPYFPTQSENLYLDHLGNLDRRIYIPGLGHGSQGGGEKLMNLIPSLIQLLKTSIAFTDRVSLHAAALPNFTSELVGKNTDNGKLRIKITSDSASLNPSTSPKTILYWSESRADQLEDFRGQPWQKITSVQFNPGATELEIPLSSIQPTPGRNLSFFANLLFEVPRNSGDPISVELSTPIFFMQK